MTVSARTTNVPLAGVVRVLSSPRDPGFTDLGHAVLGPAGTTAEPGFTTGLTKAPPPPKGGGNQ